MHALARRPRLGFAALLAALALTAACGDDGSPAATTAAPTSVATTAAGTTTSPPTTARPTTTAPPTTARPTTTAPPSTAPPTSAATTTTTVAIPTNPSDYASAFVQAWARGERATAERLGTADAVTTLFAQDPGTGAWTLATCDGAAGSSYCTFTSGTSSIVVRVGNEKASLGQPQAVDEVRIGG